MPSTTSANGPKMATTMCPEGRTSPSSASTKAVSPPRYLCGTQPWVQLALSLSSLATVNCTQLGLYPLEEGEQSACWLQPGMIIQLPMFTFQYLGCRTTLSRLHSPVPQGWSPLLLRVCCPGYHQHGYNDHVPTWSPWLVATLGWSTCGAPRSHHGPPKAQLASALLIRTSCCRGGKLVTTCRRGWGSGVRNANLAFCIIFINMFIVVYFRLLLLFVMSSSLSLLFVHFLIIRYTAERLGW